MPKEIRGKLFIPNVHMDAIYIQSLFSGSDRALIGRNHDDDALQVDSQGKQVTYAASLSILSRRGPVRAIVKKKYMPWGRDPRIA